MNRSFAGLALFTTALFSASTSAQQGAASLTGQVVDATGAAIPGARVTASDSARGIKVTVSSDASGNYNIPQLEPSSHYLIEVTKEGFRSTSQRDVILQVAQAAKIDITMSVGAAGDVIEVLSTPPQLDTQSSSLGQVITGQTVADLPLNGRSTFRLIALTPGVTFSPSAYGQFGDVAVNSTWDTNFTINGGRAQSNEILIDGVPSSAGFFDQITTLPTVDETEEFKVQSNNLSAQYGRFSGGVINVTTKAGTNEYHGNAFEFVRNSFFDANDWITKHNGKTLPHFSLNQYGGTLGGPVTIPGVYHGRDRTFFFFAFQRTQRTKGSVFTATVPTPAQIRGDFSAAGLKPIYNPFLTDPVTKNRAQFAGNIIPASMLDPVAVKLASYFPAPNAGAPGAVTNNYISNAPVVLSQNIYTGRVDQNITQKYHLSGRYAYSNTPLTQPDVYGNVASTGTGAVGTTLFRNQSFALNNLYQFSSTFLLNVNYGFARWFQSRQTRSYGFDSSTLGFPSSYTSQITIPMFPGVGIGGGYSGLANQSYLSNGNDSHAVLISAAKVWGRQTLNFGVDGRVHRINFFNVGNSAGLFNFAVAQTQGPNAAVANNGNAFASFILGAGSSGSFPVGSGVEMQNYYGAVYLQDDVRLAQSLTINLGVRYDGETPYTDRHNQLNFFDTGVSSPAANASFPNLKGGLVFAGANGADRTVYTVSHTNVVPRVGFAYNPQPNTSVRGGYGISFAPLELSNNAVGFSPSLGFASSTAWNVSNDGGFTPANLLRNPFPQGIIKPSGSLMGAGTQLGQAITVWSRNAPTPYAQQWNMDVQHQFASVLLDLGYAASHGVHLTSTVDLNTLDPQYLALGNGLTTQVANPFRQYVSVGTLSNATVARRQLLLPFPQFQSVQLVNQPYGSSVYHSLQAKLVKRMSNGVSLLASYTWSKLISNVNAQNAPIGPTTNTGPQNFYNLNGERSVSELDQPHNFVLNAVYQLPIGQGKHFLGNVGPGVEKLIGGWKLTSIVTAQSGFPLTFSAAGVGAGTRPNLVPGVDPRIQGSRSNQLRTAAWFNTAAFVTPPAYTFGTVGRTFTNVRGPGVSNLDASLQKDVRFEGLTLELRAEVFNVTNTPHFGTPSTAVQDVNFGQVTTVAAAPPARDMQFAAKVSF